MASIPQLILPGVQLKETEWNDQTVYIAGKEITKLSGIKYGVEVEQEHLFAAGDTPHSIQQGNRKPTGSLKVYKSSLDAMNAAAMAAGGRDICDISFDIQIIYRPQGVRGLKRINISGVRISKFEFGWEQGAKNMQIEMPFLCLDIKYLD